jgi:hypothetical protein
MSMLWSVDLWQSRGHEAQCGARQETGRADARALEAGMALHQRELEVTPLRWRSTCL